MAAFFWPWYIFNWRDIIEIVFFTICIYRLSRWCVHDIQKNLLGYVYGYLFMMIMCSYMEMHTIATVLTIFAPAAAMICILLHQKTLQKNFIALKNIVPIKENSSPVWVETLIRSALRAQSQVKQFRFIIEKNDLIEPFITSYHSINCKIHKNLLDIIFASAHLHADLMIWLTANGQIKGINAKWKPIDSFNQINTDAKDEIYSTHALFYSTQFDIWCAEFNPKIHTTTVMLQGNTQTLSSTHKLLDHINTYLGLSPSRIGDQHAIPDTNTSSQHFYS